MAISRKKEATEMRAISDDYPEEERTLPTSAPATRGATDTTTTLSPQVKASVATAPDTTATPSMDGNPRSPSVHDIDYHMSHLMRTFDDSEQRRKLESKKKYHDLIANIGEALAQRETAWGAPDARHFYDNLRKQGAAPIEALDAAGKDRMGLYSLASNEQGRELDIANANASREAAAARAAQSQANADRSFGLSREELERKKASDAALDAYRQLKLLKKGKGGGGGTLTKKGDIGLEIEVPPRDEYWGSDHEYNNLKKLAASKSPADRDKAFKYLEVSDTRKLQHAPDPTKFAEADTAGRKLQELLSTQKNGEIPGLGGSIPERLSLTNTGVGIIDKLAHNAGFAMLPTEQQNNFTKFQEAANLHIKAMAGAGVTNSELERAMTAAGAANPFTDPKVRANIIRAWEKDNSTLQKKLKANPYLSSVPGEAAEATSAPPISAGGKMKFPVRVLATKDNTIHRIKNQADLDEALKDKSDPVVIIGSE